MELKEDHTPAWVERARRDIKPVTAIQWRHQNDRAADAEERERTTIYCNDESLTQQQFAKDADLNEIVRRFGITDGAIPPQAIDPAYFGDFSDVPDFRTALETTRAAIDNFNNLPAELRKRFGNDPVELHNFVHDEANEEEAIKLGLLKKLPPEVPEGVRSRRELAAWAIRPENSAEAAALGLAPAPVKVPEGTPPVPPKV